MISVAIMGKNKEDSIKRCLDSVAWADEIAYLDTGSTDRTVEIVSEYPNARISYYPWGDHFAEARNISFERCSGDIIIQLDCDEEIRTPDFGEYLKCVFEQTEANAICVKLISETREGLALNYPPRIFRARKVHFVGRKHNQPVIEGASKFAPSIFYYHIGYNLGPEETAAKNERDLRLLRMQIEENPASTFARRNLLRTLRAMGSYEELIHESQELFRLAAENGWKISAQSRQMAEIDTAIAYFKTANLDQAEEALSGLLEAYPANIDAWHYFGCLSLEQEKYPRSIEAFEKYLALIAEHQRNPQFTYLLIDTWGSVPFAYNNMALCHSHLGGHKKAYRLHSIALDMKPDNATIRRNYEASLKKLAPGDPLKILFYQNVTSSRNRKLAVALRSAGHSVTLAYSVENRFADDSCYDSIEVTNTNKLMDMVKNYDIVHAMDTVGYGTLLLKEFTDAIVVRDIHDLAELMDTVYGPTDLISSVSARRADGCTFSTPHQEQLIMQMCGIGHRNMLTILNYASRSETPQERKPKLSEQDGEFHIVFEGYVGTDKHIDIREVCESLAAAHIHVHIYPAVKCEDYEAWSEGSPYLHLYETLPFDQLIVELSQYDAGIVAWNQVKGSSDFIGANIPNKLFDYVLAGLPVIAIKSPAMEWYINAHQAGLVYETVDDIIDHLADLKAIDVSGKAEFMEDEIDLLVGFYRTLSWQRNRPFESVRLTMEDIRNREESHLDSVYELYHAGHEQTVRRIDRIVAEAKGDLLDIGTSGGIIPLLYAQKNGHRAAGIDLSETHLQRAEALRNQEPEDIRSRLSFVVAQAEQLPYSSESLDTIVMGQLLEHVLDPEVVIEEALRVLKQDGRLIVSVPAGVMADPKHLRHYTEQSFRAQLEPFCRVDSIEHIGPRVLAICSKG